MIVSSDKMWRRVKKGDLRAFEFIYKTYYTQLCLYAYGFIPDEELVKELVNDLFMKIWIRRGSIDIKYGIKPYLYRSVHNLCIDRLEHKGFQNLKNRISISEIIFDIEGENEDFIFRHITSRNIEKDLEQSLSKLPPKCREVFILSRFELLSHKEISEKLNVSVNTVRTHISRALEILRESLESYL